MMAFLQREPLPKRHAIRSACIISKGTKEIDRVAIEFATILKARKIEPYLIEPLRSSKFRSLDSFTSISKTKTDLVVIVGGDGTILKTVRNIGDSMPILGINMGGRGLLAEVEPEFADKAVKKIIDGKYFLDRRIRLQAKVGRKKLPPALNEVYIDRLTKLRAPTYKIAIDGGPTIVQRMDGVMISTPTGSTGHSLSLGSTIVNEGMDAFLLTPVAPVFRMPPIVIPPHNVDIESTDNSSILIDGQLDFPFRAGNKITISKYAKDALFVRFVPSPFRQLKKLGF